MFVAFLWDVMNWCFIIIIIYNMRNWRTVESTTKVVYELSSLVIGQSVALSSTTQDSMFGKLDSSWEIECLNTRSPQPILLYSGYSVILKEIQISFTLYPAHSRVGRRNILLRHSAPHFPPNSGSIEWRNSTPRFCTRVKKWNKFKQVFHTLEWGSNTTSRVYNYT